MIRSWNKGAERLFGYGAEEVIGQADLPARPAWAQGEELAFIACMAKGESSRSLRNRAKAQGRQRPRRFGDDLADS